MVEGIAALPLGQFQRPIGCGMEEEVGSVRCLQGYHIRICREPHGKGNTERESLMASISPSVTRDTHTPVESWALLLQACLPPRPPPLPAGCPPGRLPFPRAGGGLEKPPTAKPREMSDLPPHLPPVLPQTL